MLGGKKEQPMQAVDVPTERGHMLKLTYEKKVLLAFTFFPLNPIKKNSPVTAKI